MKKPNILLITTDQQRFDTVGPDAPDFMHTPHFDLLCDEGVRFSQARSHCPVCVPTRVSIMNGKTIFQHTMTRNNQSSRFMGHDETLPALLRGCGYQSAAIGKMHFGPARTRHGFDEMIIPRDYYLEMEQDGPVKRPLCHGGGQNEHIPLLSTVPEHLTLTSWITERSVDYIRERRDPSRPFFLWTSYGKPHIPLDPPEPYYSMYRDADIPDPVFGRWAEDESLPHYLRHLRLFTGADHLSPRTMRDIRSAYYGLCTQIDNNLGRLFAALIESGEWTNTLIVFTSDHGEFLGDHGFINKGPFQEASCRVPFVMRLPREWNNRPNAVVSDALATHTDLLPTFLRAAGGEVPLDCHGLDLTEVARGTQPGREYLIGGHGQDPQEMDYLAITDGSWKYIWYCKGGREHLFNVADDPDELNDLSDDAGHAKEKQRLRSRLLKEQQENNGGIGLDPDNPGSFVTIEPTEKDSPAVIKNNRWTGALTEMAKPDTLH